MKFEFHKVMEAFDEDIAKFMEQKECAPGENTEFSKFVRASSLFEKLHPESVELPLLWTFTTAWLNPNDVLWQRCLFHPWSDI